MSHNLTVDASMRILHHVLSTATNHASAAMCRWVGSAITLTLDEVSEVPLEEVLGRLNVGDEMVTAIVLTLDGSEGGTLLLMFDETSGRHLAATLLQREVSSDPEWTEIEISALNETGNILGCAYMNALTKLVDVELVPSIPYFLCDYGASVLQQALMAQAITMDKVLVCNTKFHRGDEDLNWNVIFVPSDRLRTKLEAAVELVD
jgi:chemotaxis protein CheC